jgi:2-oxoglutarate ferredoxin oxidoreductase subunit delta
MSGKRSFWVGVDEDLCDGCGICLFFCKPAVFETSETLNRRGFTPALALRPAACTGCMLCERACPQLAVVVERVERGDDAPAAQPMGVEEQDD